MIIDLKSEPLITFGEAVRLLPKGSRPSYSSWWRWWRKGVRGVKLETAVVGGKRYTTAEALQRFVAALSDRGDQFPAHFSLTRSDRDRRAAENELREKGVL